MPKIKASDGAQELFRLTKEAGFDNPLDALRHLIGMNATPLPEDHSRRNERCRQSNRIQSLRGGHKADKPMTKISAKQRVLAVYPRAKSWTFLAGLNVSIFMNQRRTAKEIGEGRTESEAWADAAARLKERHGK